MARESLRIVMAPVGTRGDVAPLLALAQELARRGHQTTFCPPRDAADLVESCGFPVAACTPAFSSFLDGTHNEFYVLREVFNTVPDQFAILHDVAENADVIIGSMLQLAAPSIAELVGAKYYYAMFSPTYLQTTTIPVPIPLGARKIIVRSPTLIRALWFLRDIAVPIAARGLQKERAKIGLKPIKSVYDYLARSGELLLAFDPELTPVPTDIDYGHPTGYWPLPGNGDLDTDLRQFLEAGDRPVYLGFGSMRHQDLNRLLEQLEGALDGLGVRAVISTGLDASPRSSDSQALFYIRGAPHDRLFPRTRLVVHHGGAGTVATGARAGVPQLIVPHLGDQFYNGTQINALGLGPAPLPFGRLDVQSLRHRIASGLDPRFQNAAASMAERLKIVDGVGTAARIIEG